MANEGGAGVTEKRYALFIPSLLGGGVERVMMNLGRGLARRQRQVDLIVCSSHGEFRDAVPSEIRLVDLRAGRVARGIPGLVSYLRREQPDVLVAAQDHANLAALLASRIAGGNTAVVVTAHSLVRRTCMRAPKRARVLPMLMRLLYPRAAAVVAVSRGVADDVADVASLQRSSVHVIYNPVIFPDHKDRGDADLRHPWLLPGAPPLILAVGRLEYEKDYYTLIRAFALVRQRLKCRLLILGEGKERQGIQKLVDQIGLSSDVCLPGFVQDPYPYIRRASTLVLSSLWEGLPTVLIEALPFGTPIVSTDAGPGPREILCNGKYGRLVPVGMPDALAESILSSIDEGRRTLPEEAWKPYTEEVALESYMRLFEDLYSVGGVKRIAGSSGSGER
jgi:glycosyltransferase involved in cell wall biosynthesis